MTIEELPVQDAAARLGLPDDWQKLLQWTVAGNELWRVGALFLAILLAFVAGRVTRWLLQAASRRAAYRGRALLGATFRALALASVPALLVAGLSLGLEFLVMHPAVSSAAQTIVRILAALAVGYAAFELVGVVNEWLAAISGKTASRLDDMLVPLVSKSLRGTIVILVLVQIATILSDKPVTSILAGLGVGGLAVGLAAQDTIKNFFGSLMIFSDRPFELGDEIVFETHTGVVEVVGFRSTRLRTADGFQITIPNGELANKAIVNITRRGNLVRRMQLVLAADTSADKAHAAVAVLRQVLADHEGQPPHLPPRVFLADLTSQGPVVSATLWYTPPDAPRFAALNERINLELLRQLSAADISLAPPAGKS